MATVVAPRLPAVDPVRSVQAPHANRAQRDDGRVLLREVLAALSQALDLTEGVSPGHCVRSCAIGMRLGEAIGLGPADRSALFYALLLKDAGCSSNAARMAWLFTADDLELKRTGRLQDWTDKRSSMKLVLGSIGRGLPLHKRVGAVLHTAKAGKFADELVTARCERGAEIAGMLGMPDAAADAIATLEERWDGLGRPMGFAGEEIPHLSRILVLAQNLEMYSLGGRDPRAGIDMAIERRGTWFEPRLVDALVALGADDRLWADLREATLQDLVDRYEPPEVEITVDDAGLDRTAQAFARVVDAKSPFTAAHSTRVAAIADHLAAHLGLDERDRIELGRAALLHDIGKLAVSNRILDKPGRLTREEFAAVKVHPDVSLAVLRGAPCFSSIADMAARHHEKLDGTGYGRGVSGEVLGLQDRILAVADIYEAVTAHRPYRDPMSVERAREILRSDAPHKLDGDCVEAIDSLPADVATCAPPTARDEAAMRDIAGWGT